MRFRRCKDYKNHFAHLLISESRVSVFWRNDASIALKWQKHMVQARPEMAEAHGPGPPWNGKSAQPRAKRSGTLGYCHPIVCYTPCKGKSVIYGVFTRMVTDGRGNHIAITGTGRAKLCMVTIYLRNGKEKEKKNWGEVGDGNVKLLVYEVIAISQYRNIAISQ